MKITDLRDNPWFLHHRFETRFTRFPWWGGLVGAGKILKNSIKAGTHRCLKRSKKFKRDKRYNVLNSIKAIGVKSINVLVS